MLFTSAADGEICSWDLNVEANNVIILYNFKRKKDAVPFYIEKTTNASLAFPAQTEGTY